MTRFESLAKRTLDLTAALVGLVLTGWLILLFALVARVETGRTGIFRQQRIGRHGMLFWIWKIRTMRPIDGLQSTTTLSTDPRITRWGRFARRWKVDELPQLVNVLKGEMSLVGPRPDVPRYLERIRREAPLVLTVRPGITGPASLKYRDEEELLAAQPDPEDYNDRVVFADKLRINEDYVRNYRLTRDLVTIWRTIWPSRKPTPSNPADSTETSPQRAA